MEEKKITTSEQVRQLYDVGMKVKEIAKELGIRYQFAYNVISAYNLEQRLKSEQEAGKVVGEIAVTVTQPAPLASVITAAPIVLDSPPVAETQKDFVMKTPVEDSATIPPRAEVHTLNTKESVLARLFRK